MNDLFDDPKQQGLLSAALAMLAASGPSPRRTSVGQVLGIGGMKGLDAYNEAKDRNEVRLSNELRRKVMDMQFQKMQEALNEEKQVADAARASLMDRTQMSLAGGQGPTTQAADLMNKLPQGANQFDMQGFTNRLFGINPAMALKYQAEMRAANKPTIVGNYIYDEATGEFRGPPQKPTAEWEMIPDRTPGGQMMQRNKLTGEIKPIGSGPPQPNSVFIQQASKAEAKGRVSENLQSLAGAYYDLDRLGAAVSDKKEPLDNIIAWGRSSKPGQMLESAIGTQAQTVRNRINQMRPLLIQEIRQATQMGARGLDSNRELEFYLQAATDPTWSIESNIAAMAVLDNAYGLGLGIKGDPAAISNLRNQFGGSAQQSDIPADAIKLLKMDPSLAPYFDQKYGAGSSAKYLGR